MMRLITNNTNLINFHIWKWLKSHQIAILYILFSIFSLFINIGIQFLSVTIHKGWYSIEISILAGTIIGMPLRYWLEKKYIFFYSSKTIINDGKIFILYGCVSVFTTLIFWSVEYTFHIFFKDEFLRYLGGILGLSFGYFIKYTLDKKIVFKK